ncbi:endonuclease/exonuclease/phosphatase family protein [Dyadobacter sp. 32]|uniref:endonuclease/exonuclease/phosphatase family protein n=1 Tax=Dyadobacter sp. 32 TaxID=538966 RepID=UPI0011EC19E9
MKKAILLVILLGFLSSIVLAQKNKPITIASYNLRLNTEDDGINAWPNRKEQVKALVRFYEFDIWGTQEAFIDQLKDLESMAEFGHLGAGRDDGKEAGEHSAIFYRKSRFKVLQSGDFWLSETPEKPGIGWDATCCNRICSWAKFKDLVTKKELYVFNVHFDHRGKEARLQSGYLMVRKIKEIAGDTPVILTGDFNSTPETEQIRYIQSLLNDSKTASVQPPYGPEGTSNSFKFDAPLQKRIDYIFVSKGIQVLKYGVLSDSKHQRYPSDHLPVLIKAVVN